jgi:FecR protein
MAPINQNSDTARLHRLIDELCDSSITSGKMQELNKRLESDSHSRSEYLNHMCVEAGLCSLFLKTDHPEKARPVMAASGPQRGGWGISQLLALAAAIAVMTLGAVWFTYESTHKHGPLADGSANISTGSQAVARITGTRNCLWARDNGTIGFGTTLAVGQLLELKTGLAEITFSGGARIVLEGPSSFRVPESQSAELLAGRMSASVPLDSTDFSVSTPRLAIHDAGAQFGLIANDNGFSEVHVFEGSVQAMLLDEQGQTVRRVDLADRNGARLAPRSSEVTFISANERSFVRSLAPSTGPAGGLLAIEEFDYPVGPLAWQNGGFGWAGPWADIEVASDPSESGAAQSNGVAMGSLMCRDALSLGNRACQTGQANRIRRTLSTSIGGVFDAAQLIENQDGLRLIGREGKTVYLSFLQRVSKTDDVFYGFELHRGDGNYNRVLCIGNGAEGSGYGVTSNFNAYLGEKCALLGKETTDANFFIVRIEFGPKNEDVVTVFRNPRSLDEESRCVPVASLRGNFAFDRISLANFEGKKIHEVDEIRVGMSFRAVTVERGQLEMPLAELDPGRRLRIAASPAKRLAIFPCSIRTVFGSICF